MPAIFSSRSQKGFKDNKDGNFFFNWGNIKIKTKVFFSENLDI